MGNISLVGATSGATTLQPQSTGTYTVTLPAGTGTLSLTANPTFTGVTTESTITSPAATNLTLQSAGTTAMTIDTSQNVGIGATSLSQKLQVGGSIYMSAGNGTAVSWSSDLSSHYVKFDTTLNGLIMQGFGGLAFYTGGANERMRIDSSGNLLVGTTGYNYNYTGNAVQIGNFSAGNAVIMSKNTTAATNIIVFNNPNGQVGYINTTGSSTIFSTSSDYRLKKNVQPMTTGLATIAALKPVTYDWKVDGEKGEGFIAHELQEIVPLAVSGEKDAVGEDGTIRPQGVDYSKIVVHLVAAIQEISAKNDALTARIAALEAK